MENKSFEVFNTGIIIHWYGIIIAVALIIGVILGIREAKRRGYRSEMILDFMLIAIPLSIVCARLYYVAFEWPMYAADPIKIIAIWEGGLAIYGAVIGGLIAAIIFFSWRRVSVGEIMDIAAPSLVISQAIGRWGNFVNQEAHGEMITKPEWQWFPAGVNIEGVWYQATFFYESAWNLIVFIVLMLLRKKVKVRGGIFALYVVLYGFGRFWIESLRTDSLYWGGIRVSQALSLLLIICGITYLVIMSRRKKEYLPYDGIYSAGWTKEQIEDYRQNSKKYRAKEKAQRAALKVEAMKNAEKAQAEKTAAESKKAAKKVVTLLDKHDIAAGKALKEEEKAQKAKQKADVVEENARIAAMEAAQKAQDKVKRAEEKEKKAKEKLEKLMEKKSIAEEKAEDKDNDSGSDADE